jgi:hypothetical protein
METKKVKCPFCYRVLAHYLEGDDAKYRLICQRCKNAVLVYSAGQTALINSANVTIRIDIQFNKK